MIQDHSSQITAPDFVKEVPGWDDDASDRDLPELTPIKQNEEADDLEIDLGQKLSPLGSNRSFTLFKVTVATSKFIDSFLIKDVIT